jgi:hypothetical protein
MLYRESESTPRHRLFLCAVLLRCLSPQSTTPLRWTTNGGPHLPDRPPATKTRFGDSSILLFPDTVMMLFFTWETLHRSFNRPSVNEIAGPDAPDTCAAWRHGNALRLKQPTRDTYTYKVFTTQGALSRTRQAHFYPVEQHAQLGQSSCCMLLSFTVTRYAPHSLKILSSVCSSLCGQHRVHHPTSLQRQNTLSDRQSCDTTPNEKSAYPLYLLQVF